MRISHFRKPTQKMRFAGERFLFVNCFFFCFCFCELNVCEASREDFFLLV